MSMFCAAHLQGIRKSVFDVHLLTLSPGYDDKALCDIGVAEAKHLLCSSHINNTVLSCFFCMCDKH